MRYLTMVCKPRYYLTFCGDFALRPFCGACWRSIFRFATSLFGKAWDPARSVRFECGDFVQIAGRSPILPVVLLFGAAQSHAMHVTHVRQMHDRNTQQTRTARPGRHAQAVRKRKNGPGGPEMKFRHEPAFWRRKCRVVRGVGRQPVVVAWLGASPGFGAGEAK